MSDVPTLEQLTDEAKIQAMAILKSDSDKAITAKSAMVKLILSDAAQDASTFAIEQSHHQHQENGSDGSTTSFELVSTQLRKVH
ncbi:hypothetical protein [Vibrio bathopelagicus]